VQPVKSSQNSLFEANTSVRSVAESRILGLVHGLPVFSTTLADLGKQPWLATIASREQGLGAVEQLAPADGYDYDLRQLWQWRAAGRLLEDHHLATSEEVLVRALDLERGRANGLLTQWDGDLSARSGQSRWLRLAERPVLSAPASRPGPPAPSATLRGRSCVLVLWSGPRS
jgi:hypothetical protein